MTVVERGAGHVSAAALALASRRSVHGTESVRPQSVRRAVGGRRELGREEHDAAETDRQKTDGRRARTVNPRQHTNCGV